MRNLYHFTNINQFNKQNEKQKQRGERLNTVYLALLQDTPDMGSSTGSRQIYYTQLKNNERKNN